MKKNLGITYDKLIFSPLYKLAEIKLIKERKFIILGKQKFVEPALVILKMKEIQDMANKQGQKEKLDNYIKGAYK